MTVKHNGSYRFQPTLQFFFINNRHRIERTLVLFWGFWSCFSLVVTAASAFNSNSCTLFDSSSVINSATSYHQDNDTTQLRDINLNETRYNQELFFHVCQIAVVSLVIVLSALYIISVKNAKPQSTTVEPEGVRQHNQNRCNQTTFTTGTIDTEDSTTLQEDLRALSSSPSRPSNLLLCSRLQNKDDELLQTTKEECKNIQRTINDCVLSPNDKKCLELNITNALKYDENGMSDKAPKQCASALFTPTHLQNLNQEFSTTLVHSNALYVNNSSKTDLRLQKQEDYLANTKYEEEQNIPTDATELSLLKEATEIGDSANSKDLSESLDSLILTLTLDFNLNHKTGRGSSLHVIEDALKGQPTTDYLIAMTTALIEAGFYLEGCYVIRCWPSKCHSKQASIFDDCVRTTLSSDCVRKCLKAYANDDKELALVLKYLYDKNENLEHPPLTINTGLMNEILQTIGWRTSHLISLSSDFTFLKNLLLYSNNDDTNTTTSTCDKANKVNDAKLVHRFLKCLTASDPSNDCEASAIMANEIQLFTKSCDFVSIAMSSVKIISLVVRRWKEITNLKVRHALQQFAYLLTTHSSTPLMPIVTAISPAMAETMSKQPVAVTLTNANENGETFCDGTLSEDIFQLQQQRIEQQQLFGIQCFADIKKPTTTTHVIPNITNWNNASSIGGNSTPAVLEHSSAPVSGIATPMIPALSYHLNAFDFNDDNTNHAGSSSSSSSSSFYASSLFAHSAPPTAIDHYRSFHVLNAPEPKDQTTAVLLPSTISTFDVKDCNNKQTYVTNALSNVTVDNISHILKRRLECEDFVNQCCTSHNIWAATKFFTVIEQYITTDLEKTSIKKNNDCLSTDTYSFFIKKLLFVFSTHSDLLMTNRSIKLLEKMEAVTVAAYGRAVAVCCRLGHLPEALQYIHKALSLCSKETVDTAKYYDVAGNKIRDYSSNNNSSLKQDTHHYDNQKHDDDDGIVENEDKADDNNDARWISRSVSTYLLCLVELQQLEEMFDFLIGLLRNHKVEIGRSIFTFILTKILKSFPERRTASRILDICLGTSTHISKVVDAEEQFTTINRLNGGAVNSNRNTPWSTDNLLHPFVDINVGLFGALVDICVKYRIRDVIVQLVERYRDEWSTKFLPDLQTCGILIKTLGSCHRIDDCRWIFHHVISSPNTEPTEVTYGCILDALVNNNCVTEAVTLFNEMKAQGKIKPNTIMYSTIVKGYAQDKRLDEALAVHDTMKAQDIPINTVTYNTLVDACARVGAMVRAASLLEDMLTSGVEPDLITFSTIAKGYCIQGDVARAMQLLTAMRERGIRPDGILYNSLLDGCVRALRLDLCEELWHQMQSSGIAPSNFTLTILIKMFGRAGQLTRAFEAVRQLPKKYGFRINAHVYTCLMSACIANREFSKALEVFQCMKKDRIAPDSKTYETVLYGLSRSGNFDEAIKLVREVYHLNEASSPKKPLATSRIVGFHMDPRSIKTLWTSMREVGCLAMADSVIQELCNAYGQQINKYLPQRFDEITNNNNNHHHIPRKQFQRYNKHHCQASEYNSRPFFMNENLPHNTRANSYSTAASSSLSFDGSQRCTVDETTQIKNQQQNVALSTNASATCNKYSNNNTKELLRTNQQSLRVPPKTVHAENDNSVVPLQKYT